MVVKTEEQALYILQLDERMKRLENNNINIVSNLN